jgi:putative transposase
MAESIGRPPLPIAKGQCRAAPKAVARRGFTRWRRQGWGVFWRWKTKPCRPRIPVELQALIYQMARDNVTWGQRRIANELRLKLGWQVSSRTVCKYMPKRLGHGPGQRMQSQHWRTFMCNHVRGLIVSEAYEACIRSVHALYGRIMQLLQRCGDGSHRRRSSPTAPQRVVRRGQA